MGDHSHYFIAKTRGFTLIELAIVIAIIGLIIGGILTGQEMIKNAEINDMIRQIDKYQTAAQVFRDKYQAMPGDIDNATALGVNRDASGAVNSCYTTGTSYDGNNDRVLDDFAGATIQNNGELANFWFHLTNTALIDEQVATTNPNCSAVQAAGQFYPEATFGEGMIALSHMGRFHFLLGYGGTHTAAFSGQAEGNAAGAAPNLLTALEAFRLDRKMDDAVPDAGRMFVITDYTATTATTGTLVVDATDNATNCIFNGEYNASYEPEACSLAVIAE